MIDYTAHVEEVKKTLKEADFKADVFLSEIVGSSYIEDSTKSDVDVLVLVKSSHSVDEMYFYGWNYGGSVGEGNESCWGSWKKHFQGRDLNMLVTTSLEYFNSWLTAAEVCRFLHLMSNSPAQGMKPMVQETKVRIGIHNILMDDSTAEDEYKNATGVDTSPLI